MHNYCMRRRSWYNVPRASIPDGKRCKMSLGLEPSLRAGSLCAYGIMDLLQTTRGVRGPGKLAVGRNDIVAAIRNPFYPPPSTL